MIIEVIKYHSPRLDISINHVYHLNAYYQVELYYGESWPHTINLNHFYKDHEITLDFVHKWVKLLNANLDLIVLLLYCKRVEVLKFQIVLKDRLENKKWDDSTQECHDLTRISEEALKEALRLMVNLNEFE